MPEMMTSLLLGPEQLVVRSVSRPTPQEGELLLRVRACSICGSDLRIFHHGNDRVRYPAVLGHELAGDVVEVGPSVTGFAVGERVCLGADVPSMQDDWSRNGMGNLSDVNYAIGYQFPGGFAEYCLLNRMTVQFGPIVRIPDHVSYAEAALAEPLGCCLNGLERGLLAPGKTVLILGAGPVGIMLARAAAAFGAGLVVLADIDPSRIERASNLALSHCFVLHERETPATLSQSLTKGAGFDLVLTACPSPQAQEQAIEVVAKRGVVNLFGGLPNTARKIYVLSNILHYREAYLTGSHGSSPRHHKLAVELIAQGRIDVRSLITHVLPLSAIREAFAHVERREGLKIVIDPTLS